MWYICIKRKWISWGADFDIVTEGRKIGLIDGKLIGLGYNAFITVVTTASATGSWSRKSTTQWR
jgi:hypothetical protein